MIRRALQVVAAAALVVTGMHLERGWWWVAPIDAAIAVFVWWCAETDSEWEHEEANQ